MNIQDIINMQETIKNISDEDCIEIIYPETIGDIRKHIIKSKNEIFVNEVKANNEYIINNGDKLVFEEVFYNEEAFEENDNLINNSEIIVEKNSKDKEAYGMKVTVNGDEVIV